MTATTADTSWEEVFGQLGDGGRFVGLFCCPPGAGGDRQLLTVVLATPGGLELLDVEVGREYDALTPRVPAAQWYERAVRDHGGPLPAGHPRLDPLVVATEEAIPRHVTGAGLFTIPHGPVRSGVTESIEYLVETPGEDIPRVQIRVFAKHRAVEAAFVGRDPVRDGVMLAERVEGTASVANATAYAQALERLGQVTVPEAAGLVRALHAELERIAGHLEVAHRLCEAAALNVAVARMSHHKEQVQRLRHLLCGNRFGRAVVVPGGVTPQDTGVLRQRVDVAVARLRRDIARDRDLLMVTSSFLDRLRGTGLLAPDRAAALAAVGPVGRASGMPGDVRRDRPYDAYQDLELPAVPAEPAGDVQARLEVRWAEVDSSFDVVDQMLDRLATMGEHIDWSCPVPAVDGRAAGSVEGPQGETVHVVEVREGRLARVWPRTASFHNLLGFHDVFHADVFTDFPFIEASFAVSNAGVVL